MSDTTDAAGVMYTLEGDVAVVRLDDGKANAVSHDLIKAIEAALDRAAGEAGSVLIVGRPGKFSAGFDLKAMTASAESAPALVSAGARMLVKIFTHPQPVLVACTGHALAAGALMLLAADRRLCAEGPYKVGLNEVAIGLRLPIFAVELARERLSKRHFTAATTFARIYDPAGACAAGYVDDVMPEAELYDRALAEAAEAAKLSADAFADTKAPARQPLADRILETLDADMASLVPPTAVGK